MTLFGFDARWHHQHQGMMFLLFFFFFFYSVTTTTANQVPSPPPQLNGRHFRITVLEELGFLDIKEQSNGSLEYSGYLIDMLKGISKSYRANFTYEIYTPSGYGSLCNPQLGIENDQEDDISKAPLPKPYDSIYRTQYNCGASEVHDGVQQHLRPEYATEMYLGMYYITPSRQLLNYFTIPFFPPFSGTLGMFGTATGIPTFEALRDAQLAGLQPEACAPEGSALKDFVRDSYPGLKVKGVLGGMEDIVQYFQDGTCQVYIIDGPLATSFVLRRYEKNECIANGKPIGLIGEPMSFGLSHYAIGIRRDVEPDVVNTISYWMNILMSCNPFDPNGPCPDGNLATFYQGRGGTGDECGYVLYPSTSSSSLTGGEIAGLVVGGMIFALLCSVCIHYHRLKRQERRFQKRSRVAMEQAARERELNEFIAHEVRNPLASAIAALSFVSSKANDPALIPNVENRTLMLSDIGIIDSSLQFVSELLRNMLDIHRTADKQMKLDIMPCDVLRDVFEPVSSILFMRGAKVDIITECPQHLLIEGDRMRLKQIILNLATNSSKFVERGYIKLRAEVVMEMVEIKKKIRSGSSNQLISSHHTKTIFIPKQNVYLHVEDSGPGIPPHKRNRLFAKFQESLDSLNQGTGIGLCVCKNLSELMGADIYLDEEFESGYMDCPGTRFTLKLNQGPMNGNDDGATDENGTDNGNNDGVMMATLPNGHRHDKDDHEEEELPEELSILFVDDDTMIRKLFTRSLQRVAPTWTIHEASNGETALRMVEERQQQEQEQDYYDIIFLDQYMASIEKQLLGTETVRLLRAKEQQGEERRPIICGLSANDQEEQFLDAGANGFMLKPFPCKKDLLTRELLALLHKGGYYNYHNNNNKTTTTTTTSSDSATSAIGNGHHHNDDDDIIMKEQYHHNGRSNNSNTNSGRQTV